MVVIKSRKKKIYILKLILIQIVDGFCHLLLSRDVTEGNRKWNCATTLKRICDSDRILLCWSLFSASCSIKLLWTSNKNNKCLTSHTRILVSIKRACTLGCRHSDCRHCTSFNNKTNINCMLVRWQSIRKFCFCAALSCRVSCILSMTLFVKRRCLHAHRTFQGRGNFCVYRGPGASINKYRTQCLVSIKAFEVVRFGESSTQTSVHVKNWLSTPFRRRPTLVPSPPLVFKCA